MHKIDDKLPARHENPPPIIAICGIKNSGKTTLLSKIIPILKERGFRVAAIKHDSHDFAPDVPGTDSHTLREAGAVAVGIYSPNRYMLTAESAKITPEHFASFFKDADLILLEGGKSTPYNKIEIVRSGISAAPVSDPEALIAICSDLDIRLEKVPTIAIDDYTGVADLIVENIKPDS